MEKIRIVHNRIRCKSCGDIIESEFRHDFVTCRCVACSADGGHNYLRRYAKERDCYEDLSVTEVCSDEDVDVPSPEEADKLIDSAAKRILDEYRDAFEKLAKGP